MPITSLRTRALLTLCCVLVPPMVASSQAADPAKQNERAARFDRVDRRARELLHQIGCASRVAQYRARGAFGPTDSVGGRGTCVDNANTLVGVFYEADSSLSRLTKFSAVDIRDGHRISTPIDSARFLGEARALRLASENARGTLQAGKRRFSPLIMRGDGDSVEVWFLSLPYLTGDTVLTVGGELGYIISPDGRSLGRAIDHFAAFRQVAIDSTQGVTVISTETDVPTLTEVILANVLHTNGVRCVLRTTAYDSMLMGPPGRNAMWANTRRSVPR
jgi:hypothetical protein